MLDCGLMSVRQKILTALALAILPVVAGAPMARYVSTFSTLLIVLVAVMNFTFDFPVAICIPRHEQWQPLCMSACCLHRRLLEHHLLR